MAVYKDGDKWRVIYRFTNYKGEHKQTTKRGFATKREAVAWERQQILKDECKLDMTFASFFELYEEDRKKRVKQNTWESKGHVIRTKILPYFGDRKMDEIKPTDVLAWQNEIMAGERQGGGEYSPTYLKTIHAQLSAIFNYAVRYYGLRANPAQLAGSMGSEEYKEMLFWTKEEYLKFADVMMDKPLSYYAFEVLYWTGVRVGELLALTPKDFDFEKQTLVINKSYQRIKGKDVITTPKTKKSNRIIKIPKFLCEEMQEYMDMIYELNENDRLFPFTKHYLHHEMDRGSMWEVRTYYKDWTGERKQKTKRGFAKKSEALEWERNFKLKEDQSISMTFGSFVEIYLKDLESRIKRNTFLTKKHIIETKILPYFGRRKLDEIRTADVIQWQNEMMKLTRWMGSC